MSQHFGDLEGVETDIDDIIVHADTEMKHDCRVNSVLDWCKKINLTINKGKCVFKVKKVTFISHKVTQEEIKPDDKKLRAIKDMPAPTDKKGVERLLGTVNYLGKFIPNLASVTEPIRVLLRKDIEFQWSHEQDKAFQEIKSVLTENGGPVLKFFDVQKPVTVSCDASPAGLSGVLLRLSRGLGIKIFNWGWIKKCTDRKGTLGSWVQPAAVQRIHVRKESARRIKSQTPRKNSEEALIDSTTQTIKNSAQNAKVRLHTRI